VSENRSRELDEQENAWYIFYVFERLLPKIPEPIKMYANV